MADDVRRTRDIASATEGDVRNSNQLQQELLDQIQRSNQLMQLMITLQQKMLDGTTSMAGGMSDTQKAMHLQILGGSLSMMFNSDNTQSLTPPTRMIPGCKGFADEAYPEEVAETEYSLISDGKYSSGSINSRKVSLTGAACIGGFLSLDKTKAVLTAQVDKKGPYEETAYNMSMLRYIFVRDAFFLPNIQKKNYPNKGLILQTAGYFAALKHISTLTYVNRVGLYIPDLFVNYSIDTSEVPSLGQQAHSFFQNNLSQQELADPDVQTALQSFTN
jgi:hypothetical protein